MQQKTKVLSLNFDEVLQKYFIISWIYTYICNCNLWKNFTELPVTTHFTASCVVVETSICMSFLPLCSAVLLLFLPTQKKCWISHLCVVSAEIEVLH